MDDNQFRRLLQHLELSWSGYRKVRKGVKKRIRRHMKFLGCRNMDDYLQELGNSQFARTECDHLMTVSISRFYRDRALWLILENEIFPDLIKRCRKNINVWSAGCACGEEVYSIKIVWDRLQHRYPALPKLYIKGSDMNPKYLERAKAGIYSSSSLKEIPAALRPVFFDFEPSGARYSVKPFIKKDISWKLHQLNSDLPGLDYHLIFLRNNLLTYYNDRLKMEGIRKILDRLRPAGFLVVGSHERLPPETPGLVPFPNCSYVFRKGTEESGYETK